MPMPLINEAAPAFSANTTHGPRSLATYCGTAAYQNATGLPVARAFHQAIGSTSFYTSSSIDQPAKFLAPMRHGSWLPGVHDFETADSAIVIGCNTLVSTSFSGAGPFLAGFRPKSFAAESAGGAAAAVAAATIASVSSPPAAASAAPAAGCSASAGSAPSSAVLSSPSAACGCGPPARSRRSPRPPRAWCPASPTCRA